MIQADITFDETEPALLVGTMPLPVRYLQQKGANTNDVVTFNGTDVVWGPGGGGSLPALSQYHIYAGNSLNAPVDAGVNFIADSTNNIKFIANGTADTIFTGDNSAGFWYYGTLSTGSTGNEIGFIADFKNNDYYFGSNSTGDWIEIVPGGYADVTLNGVNYLVVSPTDVTISAYPNTRDDSGSSTPINFTYTDAAGVLKSAPLTVISGLPPFFTVPAPYGSSNFPVLPCDIQVGLTGGSGATDVFLPTTAMAKGDLIIIKDAGAACSLNNINVDAGTGNTIVSDVIAQTVSMTNNGECIWVRLVDNTPGAYIWSVE